MRLAWKLAVIVAVGVGTQLLIERGADEIDEAVFAVRVYLASLRGQEPASPEVVTMANALMDRQIRRLDRRIAADRAAALATAAAVARAALAPRHETLEWELETAIELGCAPQEASTPPTRTVAAACAG